jgi:hypothetical protein
MQTIYILDHAGQLLHLRLVRMIQLFLISVEALVTIATYLMLDRRWGVRRAWLIVLLGVVLNPVAIILTTIHGNFDLVVALMIVLFIWSLSRWLRGSQAEDWLLACLCLGIGALAKTTPLVLAPLFVVGWRQLNLRLALIGGALLVGAVLLGISVIFTLGPGSVLDNVIHYHSFAGLFGITGILNILQPAAGWGGYHSKAVDIYAGAFLVLLAGVGLGVLWRFGSRRAITDRDVLLAVAGLLILMPVLGPGYAPQYAWWWLAPLVMLFSLCPGPIRWACALLFVIASGTYIIDYGLQPPYGEVLLHWPHPAIWNTWSDLLATKQGETVLRLPLFTAYLVFLALSGVELFSGSRVRSARLVEEELQEPWQRLTPRVTDHV